MAVHPRIRGERNWYCAPSLRRDGSSPHTRGTQHRHYRSHCCLRFIPAYAGNACGISTGQVSPPVHPRMRGERSSGKGQPIKEHGSSPHARGTRRAPTRHGSSTRFIPACAGNARVLYRLDGAHPVHPRMRGERSQIRSQQTAGFGSSPHARGTLLGFVHYLRGRRFIPACAGNASVDPVPRPLRAVHPRMRGERRFVVTIRLVSHGSSPHARGTRKFQFFSC